MALIERAINLTIELGLGSFGTDGFNKVELSGYRVSATIAEFGMPSLNQAQIRIYGLGLSLMNKLSQIGYLIDPVRENIVTITAGDAERGMASVFRGNIRYAWADFQGAPEVSFNITAYAAMLAQVKPAPSTSYPGPTNVAVIMQSLANAMGLRLENNGVSVTLSRPVFFGSALEQMQAAAAAADIFAFVDVTNRLLVIVPKDGTRSTGIPTVSAENGMVGYPSYIGPGAISLRTLYTPAIRFMGQIDVLSQATDPATGKLVTLPSSGRWRVRQLSHLLECQMPNGAWFTEVDASLFDRPAA